MHQGIASSVQVCSWKCDFQYSIQYDEIRELSIVVRLVKNNLIKINNFILKVVLAIALTCVVAKPDPGTLYTAPSLYAAPLAAAPLAAPLASPYYNAPLTYSAASYYRPYNYASPYASPYAYSGYNTYNYRAPLAYSAAYSALPAAAYIH